ncbi:MAG: iron-sulfur cluster assembly scaffold protein [Anaerolineae bacterium]|nr:iron-sulfur cluster assembly scaffold protein [Anaerolineae bacterium]
MPIPYSEKVIEHFKNPRNVGRMEDYDAKATEGSPACGDMVTLYLKVDEETKTIKDIKFESYGCASNIATGSIITELAKGKTLDEARKISWKAAAEELGGLPAVKVHCSVLAVDTLRAAIRNYEERHGLVEDREPTTVEVVEKRLRHVMNPLTGLDIVKTHVVKKTDVNNGVVTVWVDLSRDHQFANNIEQEIRERLEPLWDVAEVRVIFNDDEEE